MAAVRRGPLVANILARPVPTKLCRSRLNWQCQRQLKTANGYPKSVPDFAFAFDIDGVLLRSSRPLPKARETLLHLQQNRIPFILLTNGGGKHETDRVADLSRYLDLKLDTSMFIQSHTPFTSLVHGSAKTPALKDKCVLVLGGESDSCRRVAESYGFANVIVPADIITANPNIMPFVHPSNYESYARPLPRPLATKRPPSSNSLKVDAIFVFNDPRDWALDIQLIIDLLLSKSGIIGTLSELNGSFSLPNRGYQQDGQPPLYFSNPDLFWAAEFHLPRLGQGGFRKAVEGVWSAMTGGPENGVVLQKTMIGKPHRATFAYAEEVLNKHRKALFSSSTSDGMLPLKRVYMIGDNPASDILGANTYNEFSQSKWYSILVRSGVYGDGEPDHQPSVTVDGVGEAVGWALKQSNWQME